MLSRNILSRRFAFLLILLLCTMLPLTSAASLSMGSSAAAVSSPPDFPDNEETRRLLEQTLSSAEIEREILRVTAEQKVLEKKVSLLSKQAAEKEAAIADQQERAGAVIRSYYMGDRDSLLAALLSAKSISRMLALYDYYEIIIGQDRDILNHYEEQYKDMKSTITASLRSSKELEELKTALTEQNAGGRVK